MLINCLAVGVGGFIGSVFRYLIGLIPFLNRHDIPFQTLAVNVLGAVLIGMIVKSAETCELVSGPVLLFIKVGICGGFTTFSTFSLETVNLIECGRLVFAGLYVLSSVILCIIGVLIGKYVAGLIVN